MSKYKLIAKSRHSVIQIKCDTLRGEVHQSITWHFLHLYHPDTITLCTSRVYEQHMGLRERFHRSIFWMALYSRGRSKKRGLTVWQMNEPACNTCLALYAQRMSFKRILQQCLTSTDLFYLRIKVAKKEWPQIKEKK